MGQHLLIITTCTLLGHVHPSCAARPTSSFGAPGGFYPPPNTGGPVLIVSSPRSQHTSNQPPSMFCMSSSGCKLVQKFREHLSE
eukprot:5281593-Amphidinium_carterae.1